MAVRPKKRIITAPAIVQPVSLKDYGFGAIYPQIARDNPPDRAQLMYDQLAFAHRKGGEHGAPPRTELFWRLADAYVPGYFERHEWSEKLIDALCNNYNPSKGGDGVTNWLGVTGCSGAAKTYNILGFACLWWLCAPLESSVTMCSTGVQEMKKRTWAKAQRFRSMIPDNISGGVPLGDFIDSRLIWKWGRPLGSDTYSVAGIAVQRGKVTEAADKIKGLHTLRQMVIVDEATAVPEAIMEANTNLWRYPVQAGGEFVLILIGNARTRLDQFGRWIEPKDGWHTVDEDDEEWETTPKFDGNPGLCIRFDALKTPNLKYPEDKPISRHIPTRSMVEALLKNSGYRNSASYWSNERGFPAPDGMNRNVFSETAISAHDGYGKHTFTGRNFQILGAVDPARLGGDRPTLRFVKMGETTAGGMGLQLGKPIVIPVDARSSNPVDYQIVEQVKRECEMVRFDGDNRVYSCPAKNLGVDATGGGADLVDIFQRTFSPDVVRIIFSASPTTDPVSNEDVRPAKDVFRNLRAQMYFRARDMLDSGQLKGLDKETATELCNITFDDQHAKIVLISKADYKETYGNSPDYADTVAMAAEMAKRRGFQLKALGQTVNRGREFSEAARKAEAIYDESDSYRDVEDEQAEYEGVY